MKDVVPPLLMPPTGINPAVMILLGCDYVHMALTVHIFVTLVLCAVASVVRSL